MAKYVNSDNLSYYNGKIKNLLNGKASTSHTHDLSTMINTLSTGDSVPVDTDYYVAQYVGGGNTTTTYHRRPVSALYSYIKGKTDTLYAPKSHTHNYAGSTSAGGSAKSVANSLSIQLNGGTATTFNGSAAKSINITASSVGAASSSHNHDILNLTNYASHIWDATTSRPANAVLIGPNGSNGVASFRKLVAADLPSHNHSRLELQGTNSITTPTQDTQANWLKVGNSVHYFSKTGEITDQKSQYGFVVNITNGSSDVHQVWMTQTTGSLYHRGANNSGWSGTWRRIIDSTELVAVKNSVGCLNSFDKDWSKIPYLTTLAYWDGAHSISTDGNTHYSSLAYCNQGAFGNIVTRTVSGVNNWAVSDLYKFGKTDTIPTLETLAYWNGAWDTNKEKTWHYSNLEYCKIGKFGSGAIRNITYGTGVPTAAANNGDIYVQYSA